MTTQVSIITYPIKSFSYGLVLGIVLGVSVTLLVQLLHKAKGEYDKNQCQANIGSIQMALYNYHEQYGSFPPAYTTDARNQPMHSWRVLILPFLGERDLYGQIRLDEPWNSQHNTKFHAKIPNIYGCPSDPQKRKNGETSYVFITGEDTISNGSNCTTLSDITDGTSHTFLVVETLDHFLWMEPKDLNFDAVGSVFYEFPICKGISSHHGGVGNVGFADASVRYLPYLSGTDFESFATKSSGDNNYPIP